MAQPNPQPNRLDRNHIILDSSSESEEGDLINYISMQEMNELDMMDTEMKKVDSSSSMMIVEKTDGDDFDIMSEELYYAYRLALHILSGRQRPTDCILLYFKEMKDGPGVIMTPADWEMYRSHLQRYVDAIDRLHPGFKTAEMIPSYIKCLDETLELMSGDGTSFRCHCGDESESEVSINF